MVEECCDKNSNPPDASGQNSAAVDMSTEELIRGIIRSAVSGLSWTSCWGDLDGAFAGMYVAGDRASLPAETLLQATVLIAIYSIRSERAFCGRLNCDLLFNWFLDMPLDQPAFDAPRSRRPQTAG